MEIIHRNQDQLAPNSPSIVDLIAYYVGVCGAYICKFIRVTELDTTDFLSHYLVPNMIKFDGLTFLLPFPLTVCTRVRSSLVTGPYRRTAKQTRNLAMMRPFGLARGKGQTKSIGNS